MKLDFADYRVTIAIVPVDLRAGIWGMRKHRCDARLSGASSG